MTCPRVSSNLKKSFTEKECLGSRLAQMGRPDGTAELAASATELGRLAVALAAVGELETAAPVTQATISIPWLKMEVVEVTDCWRRSLVREPGGLPTSEQRSRKA